MMGWPAPLLCRVMGEAIAILGECDIDPIRLDGCECEMGDRGPPNVPSTGDVYVPLKNFVDSLEGGG
jgi:hypothetical protein